MKLLIDWWWFTLPTITYSFQCSGSRRSAASLCKFSIATDEVWINNKEYTPEGGGVVLVLCCDDEDLDDDDEHPLVSLSIPLRHVANELRY
jgi:hypothetical protein